MVLFAISLAGCGNGHEDSADPVLSDEVSHFGKNEAPLSLITDWPNLYGPDSNSCIELSFSPAKRFDPKVIWTTDVGKGYSAPIVANGNVFIVSRYDDKEFVECLDQNTGVKKWDYSYEATFKSTFEYSDGPYSTPLFSDGRIVTVSAEGLFHCFTETGELLWSRNLINDYEIVIGDWPVTTSPISIENQFVFNLGSPEAGIVALDWSSGKVLWSATDHPYSYSSPVVATIHDNPLIFSMTEIGLVCLDPAGNVLWEIEHKLRQEGRANAVSPLIVNDKVCIVTGPAVKPGFRCFQIQADGTYTEPWKNIRLLNSQYTNLAFYDRYLFGFTPVKQGGPQLVCIDLQKGKKTWTMKPDLGRGNLLVLGDCLLILGEDGTLAGYKINGDEKLAEVFRTESPILKKPCYTSMAFSKGLLYARNEEQLVCIDLGLVEQKDD